MAKSSLIDMTKPQFQRNTTVSKKVVMKTPLSSYKLNNKLQSAIIPRAHLAVLNQISKGINPNGFFDWGRSIWEGAKSVVPGLKHVEDLVGHVKDGAKWVKDFWDKPSFEKAIDGGKKIFEHVKKNSEKLSKLKEGDLSQLGPDIVKKYNGKLKAKQKLRTSGIHPNLSPLLSENNILKPNPLSLPPVIAENSNHHIKATNKYTSQSHQPFASSVLIMDISPATYVTGQILATFPLTSSNMFDEETAELAANKEMASFREIVGVLKSYANSSIGGSFGMFFDPDPKAQWLVGSSGIVNLQRARDEVGFKNEETFYSFESKCPLVPLKDLYWLNPATSDGRNFIPGTFVVMCVSNATITTGNDLQISLNSKGEFLSENDSYTPATFSSTILTRSTSSFLTLSPNSGIFNAAMWGNISANNYDIINTNQQVPMCTANVPSPSTFCVFSPGLYEYVVDLDNGGMYVPIATAAVMSANVNLIYGTTSWMQSNTASVAWSSRGGSYLSPVPGSVPITATNYGFTLKGRFQVGNVSPFASTSGSLSPMIQGYVESVPPLATYGPYTSGSGTVTSLGVDNSDGGYFDINLGSNLTFQRLSVRIEKIYEVISPYGGAFSIREYGNSQLNQSLIANHEEAKRAVDSNGNFIHIPQHCRICKHHKHETIIDIIDDYDEKDESDSNHSYENVRKSSIESINRIAEQIEKYQTAINLLTAIQTSKNRLEGPTNKEMHSINGNIKKSINDEEYKKFLSNSNHEIHHKRLTNKQMHSTNGNIKGQFKPKSNGNNNVPNIQRRPSLDKLRQQLIKLKQAHLNLANQTKQILDSTTIPRKYKGRDEKKDK